MDKERAGVRTAGHECLDDQLPTIDERMLESATDVFLGWTQDDSGRDYYFRQLHDMKMTLDLSHID